MARDRGEFLYILDMPWPVAVVAALSALAVLGGAALRVVYRPYFVPAGSMQPAIAVGDHVFVDKFAYAGARRIARGDIVAFRPLTGEDQHQQYIKRVIGLPGDVVQVKDGTLWLNGAPVGRTALPAYEGDRFPAGGMGSNEPIPAVRETLPGGVSYTVLDRYDGPGDHTEPYEVPDGMLFLLGDDRDNSRDSRVEMGGFVYVPIEHVEGKVAGTLRRESIRGAVLSLQRGYAPTEGE